MAFRHHAREFWHKLRFREEFLIVISVMFFATGALIDYWQASMAHGFFLPPLIKDYFGIFWLVLYTGIFPFLMIFDISDFNWRVAKVYFGALLIGTAIWDIIYSYLNTGQVVSAQEGYFFLRGQNYGLTQIQLYTWDFIRLILGPLLIKLNISRESN